MNCSQAKLIAIPTLLAALGLKAVRFDRNGSYYRSPWSASGDHIPSLQVSPDGRAYHDWVTGSTGDIIDLTQKYIGSASVSDALTFMSKVLGTGMIVPRDTQFPSQSSFFYGKLPGIIVTEVVSLQTRRLLGYLWGQRGIHQTIACAYCQEVHYYLAGRPERPYYAIGWKNDSGGYELRNRFVKQAVAPKDVTTVNDLAACPFYIFEGFMDFLSAIQLGIVDMSRSNAIVINSTSMVKRALQVLSVYEPTQIICLLDADGAGRAATDAIIGAFPSARDFSSFYRRKGYNDVNDMLVGTSIKA